MPNLEISSLRAAIKERGYNWEAGELPTTYTRSKLGGEPVPPQLKAEALEAAQRLSASRLAHLFKKFEDNSAGSPAQPSAPAPLELHMIVANLTRPWEPDKAARQVRLRLLVQ